MEDIKELRDDPTTGLLDTGESYPLIGLRQPASEEMVTHVLSQSETSGEGRSPWYWFRLSNGDLILGVYPQGSTYFDTETDRSI